MKSLDFSNVSFPKITSMKYMFADSYMSEFSYTIPSTITNIEGFLSNCPNLKTLRNFNINTNVVVTNWLQDTPVQRLIDCSFYSTKTSFKDNTTLKTVTNLTYTGNDFSSYFEGCSSLQTASVILTSSVANMTNSFKNCPNLSVVDFTNESDLSKVATINDCFNGDTNLTSLINLKITNANTTANNTTLKDCPLNDTEGLYINSNASLNMFRMGASSKITQITELNLGANADDLHDLCMDYPLLVADFVIPKNVKTVQNLFKNCVAMGNITSNWRTLYDRNRDNDVTNDVITTDCYKGCINSKYIDGDLYLDEYGNSTVMKNIPVEWGGEITYPSNLTVFDVRITEDNLTYSLVGNVADANTNWGDATEDMNPSHTYTKAGIYTIATGNLTTFATGSVISDAVSSPIVRFRQLGSSLTNGSHLFDSWRNLMIIDKIGHDLNTYEYLCNNCTSLSNDILFPATARNVTKAFYGCSNLLYIHSNWDNNYNSTVSHTDCYSGCNSITHIDGQNVIAYKGDNGLDYVPSDWGGNGFTLDNTMIYELNITESFLNKPLQPAGVKGLLSLNEKVAKVNWGDGSPVELLVYNNSLITHTYTTVGRYFVKAHVIMGGGYGAGFAGAISKILQVPKYSNGRIYNNLRYGCNGATNMTYIDMSNIAYEKGVTKFEVGSLFNNCAKLETIIMPSDLIVTDISRLCNSCEKLPSMDFMKNWDMSNCVSLNATFSGNLELESIDLSNLDASKVTNLTQVVNYCTNLKNFKAPKNISVSTSDFSRSPNLTVESMIDIINNLATVSTTQTLTLGAVNLAKLTTEQIQIATNKGWTVS